MVSCIDFSLDGSADELKRNPVASVRVLETGVHVYERYATEKTLGHADRGRYVATSHMHMPKKAQQTYTGAFSVGIALAVTDIEVVDIVFMLNA